MLTRTTIAAFLGAGVLVLALAGCVGATPPPAGDPAGATALQHTHELVPGSDGELLVATHTGILSLRIAADGSASVEGPLGGLDFDPMGFTIADGLAYASGHPGPQTPDTFASPNLGLITSEDQGTTWTTASLPDAPDFHSLAVVPGDQGPVVLAVDSSTGSILRSTDGGQSWVGGSSLLAADLAVRGTDVLAATPDGLAVSSDLGVSFTVDEAAPVLYTIASDGASVVGVDVDGMLWVRSPDGAWAQGGAITGIATALAVVGERIYLANADGIAFTDDRGTTWTSVDIP